MKEDRLQQRIVRNDYEQLHVKKLDNLGETNF